MSIRAREIQDPRRSRGFLTIYNGPRDACPPCSSHGWQVWQSSIENPERTSKIDGATEHVQLGKCPLGITLPHPLPSLSSPQETIQNTLFTLSVQNSLQSVRCACTSQAVLLFLCLLEIWHWSIVTCQPHLSHLKCFKSFKNYFE